MAVNFAEVIKANSTAKGVGALEDVELSQNPALAFIEPFGQNPNKRDLLVQDSLLNEKNFMTYWKAREKHRDPSILAYPIKTGKIGDVDHDGYDELVAYYNDGTKDNVIGYNQYALGPPKMSEKKAKATYYQKSAKDREKQSYADFLAADPDTYLTGWMNEDAIKKYKEGLEKKLITKVKKFFATNAEGQYGGHTPKQKTAVANTFIQIVAEAMIANDANRAQAAIVKGLKGFIEAKKSLVEDLMNDVNVKRVAGIIVEQILSGNGDAVEAYIENYTTAVQKKLSADDISHLAQFATQNQYMRSLAKPAVYNAQTNGAGYGQWMTQRYGGINPMTKEKYNFLKA